MGTQQCCRGGGPGPPCLPGTSARHRAATWAAGHRRRGQTPFSSVSYHLPWETVCGSPQVTGAREQSSDPSQLTPLSLRILFLGAGGEMEAGWRRRGRGGERQREARWSGRGRLQAVCGGTRGQGRLLESGWHKSHARSPGTTTLNLNWLPFKYHLRAGFPASLSS